MTLKLYDRIQNCYLSSYAVLVSNVPELQASHIACLLKAVTPASVTNTVPFLLVIEYIHRSGSFEVLQAKVKCHFSARPASLKQALPHAWWTDFCVFHVFYLGLVGKHLGQVSCSSGHLVMIYITFEFIYTGPFPSASYGSKNMPKRPNIL